MGADESHQRRRYRSWHQHNGWDNASTDHQDQHWHTGSRRRNHWTTSWGSSSQDGGWDERAGDVVVESPPAKARRLTLVAADAAAASAEPDLQLAPGPRAFDWAEGSMQVWESPQHGAVQYHARIVEPSAKAPGAGVPRAPLLPLAFYFTGLGESANMLESLASDMAAVAPEPFLLVSPLRPKGGWWFINSCSRLGWIRGSFQKHLVDRYVAWLESVARRPGVDPNRVGLFGFSAGAYAVAEMLAAGVGITLSGVGLGAVHGHGQWDLSDLDAAPAACVRSAPLKFETFLQRVRGHQGCRWIEATHGCTDKESKWADAQKIFEAMNGRQAQLGLPQLSVRRLEPEQQDCVPSKKRNRTHHSYFGVAFVRTDFLRALLGGEPPEPRKVEAPDKAAWSWSKNAGRWKYEHESIECARAGALTLRSRAQAASAGSRSSGEDAPSRTSDSDGESSPPIFEWDSGGSGKKRRWRRYSDEVQATLARAFSEQRGSGELQLAIDGFSYTVDFDSMCQVAKHSGYERKIRVSNE
mmetsp:Transcript_107402/g.310397  ORF Transcript_107402/g.310397 Transcript_107402/m.310397 type:complete len:526 (+) Transcript_107402:111-1688(+)